MIILSKPSTFCLLFFFLSGCYHQSGKKIDQGILSFLLQKKNLKIHVLGDSIAQRSGAFGLQTKLGDSFEVKDFSVSGWNSNDWIVNLNTAFPSSPDLIIIELGTNDANRESGRLFQSETETLLKEIRKRTFAITVLSAVPRTKTLLSSVIQKNNEWVRSLGYPFADLESVFLNYPGPLSLYPEDDPIHPNIVGNDLIGWEYARLIRLQIGYLR
ncbi:MAG TPA: SGNH/GDSL hydrolase family protein [Leptospiraceae bacterium]|nr:SGNH/GDSL hydrolase family protein [Leptospiraceae bacterium]HMY68718.1 SGNH/GDSL hydrolase family protein [Leptospiraceae bacterium]HMZ59738.1 SGNH/GDSL hydrolase family protein [Leptospiraceae bacterium]HNF13069.1 SGNH/GDSL hydrolase family protein [Leptospiraceae bacterium]HNF25676.1 SGNH/GDSL hydrolase family protein [Leptospiraceae bacterium]